MLKSTARLAIILLLLGCAGTATAQALQCGTFKFPKCSAPDHQFGRGFNPKTGYGGFGGGVCSAQRTPVVFIHGNGDRAVSWDSPVEAGVSGAPAPMRSVYDEFRARGYNECELFGVTYLSIAEQQAPQGNFHRPEKYRIIGKFIQAVKKYTGKPQVDIVAHSLGVTMTMAALTYYDAKGTANVGWGSVRRFVNIAGGIRGLSSCLYVGFANPAVRTCGSQNLGEPFVFGFYPDSGSLFGFNKWTGAGTAYSLRDAPAQHREIKFYTIHAGRQDQIHCTTLRGFADCAKGALFAEGPNVRAQLNAGAGSSAEELDFDFSDRSLFALKGGDVDGIGHFKARNNLGEVLYQMLDSDCGNIACRGNYRGGPLSAD